MILPGEKKKNSSRKDISRTKKGESHYKCSDRYILGKWHRMVWIRKDLKDHLVAILFRVLIFIIPNLALNLIQINIKKSICCIVVSCHKHTIKSLFNQDGNHHQNEHNYFYSWEIQTHFPTIIIKILQFF